MWLRCRVVTLSRVRWCVLTSKMPNKPERSFYLKIINLFWQVPFADLSPMECGMKIALEGLRITIPPGISPHISKLIKICMNEDPGKRPSFEMILPILEKMKRWTRRDCGSKSGKLYSNWNSCLPIKSSVLMNIPKTCYVYLNLHCQMDTLL